MKIIAFTGMPFSGKTEAVQIAREKKIPIVRMGDMVWEEVKKRGLELSDKNVGFVANEMREKHGMHVWAERTVKKIKSMDNVDFLVIDGIRNVEEIDIFKKELGEEFIVIAIEVSDKTRHERAMIRSRQDDSKDIEKVKERDRREIGWGLAEVIASSDIVISNEKDIESFKAEIRKIFEKI